MTVEEHPDDEGHNLFRRSLSRRIFKDILEEPTPGGVMTAPSGGGYEAPTVL